jgi:hypothetical protein
MQLFLPKRRMIPVFEKDKTIQPAHEMIGKRTTTLVPLPAELRMSSSAPMFSARARILPNPNPSLIMRLFERDWLRL